MSCDSPLFWWLVLVPIWWTRVTHYVFGKWMYHLFTCPVSVTDQPENSGRIPIIVGASFPSRFKLFCLGSKIEYSSQHNWRDCINFSWRRQLCNMLGIWRHDTFTIFHFLSGRRPLNISSISVKLWAVLVSVYIYALCVAWLAYFCLFVISKYFQQCVYTQDTVCVCHHYDWF